MKILEIPVFEDDGSVKFTAVLTPEQAKELLSFALNFILGVGSEYLEKVDQMELPFNEEFDD